MIEPSIISLGDLDNPETHGEPIELLHYESDSLRQMLADMLLIRSVERKLAAGRRDDLIGGPVHLGVGQEAVAVGVSTQLRSTDRVFGGHRSHSHMLALGSDVTKLFAEILGKNSGHSKGMGGSMHLWDQSVGFYGSVPIVAGTVALAVGAGMAARLSGSSDIGVAYFGDGACEEGVVHESLNLASIQKTPVLFVVENNLFASHMHILQRQPQAATARFAAANGIPYRIVDGNDVVSVATAARELVSLARKGEGPGFLEAVTYRWYGHVDWREDIDVGVSRSQNDVDLWRARDPIRRLYLALINAGFWTESLHQDLESEIKKQVERSWQLACFEKFPDPEALLDRVFVR